MTEKIKDGFVRAAIAVVIALIVLIVLGMVAFLVGGIAAWCGFTPDWLMNTCGILMIVADKALWIGGAIGLGIVIYELINAVVHHKTPN